MNRVIKLLSLTLFICLCCSIPVLAADQDTVKEEAKYIEMQSKIIDDINNCDFNYDDEITKGLTPREEKTEVVIDLTDDLNTIKQSCSEPVAIYEEVITRTFDLPPGYVIESSPSYETRTVTSSKRT